MKRFFSLSLLALMLSSCASQPISAFIPMPGLAALAVALVPSQLDKKEQFALGFITGIIPIMGQFIAGVSFLNPNPYATTAVENVSFIAGHALGMSFWTVLPYLESGKLTSNK
jgi:hypothetical protein